MVDGASAAFCLAPSCKGLHGIRHLDGRWELNIHTEILRLAVDMGVRG